LLQVRVHRVQQQHAEGLHRRRRRRRRGRQVGCGGCEGGGSG
jgi:hypothetical protein